MHPQRDRAQLAMRDVSKAYGDRSVLDQVTLTVRPGEKTAVIGENGSESPPCSASLAGAEAPHREITVRFPWVAPATSPRRSTSTRPPPCRTPSKRPSPNCATCNTGSARRGRPLGAEARRPEPTDTELAACGDLSPPTRTATATGPTPAPKRLCTASASPTSPATARSARCPAASSPGSPSPACAGRRARTAAARRADQPPRRPRRRLAGGPPARPPGDRRGDHPRPGVPGAGHLGDPGGRPGPAHGHPARGRLGRLPRRPKAAARRRWAQEHEEYLADLARTERAGRGGGARLAATGGDPKQGFGSTAVPARPAVRPGSGRPDPTGSPAQVTSYRPAPPARLHGPPPVGRRGDGRSGTTPEPAATSGPSGPCPPGPPARPTRQMRSRQPQARLPRGAGLRLVGDRLLSPPCA